MADDDGSRRPLQPSTPKNPAGVRSASNRGSPGMVFPTILREILESGDQGLIDDAFDQWTNADMGRLLETLPSPAPARKSPAGVGSAASNCSSPCMPAGAAVGAGGDGGGGGSSSGSSSSGSRSRPSTPPSGRSGTPPVPVGASTPRGRPRQAQKEPHGRGRGRGGRLPRPDPGPRRKAPPVLLSIKPICNDDCACCSKTKNKLPWDDASPTSPRPTAS